jgi:shikimate kinase
MAQQAKQPGTIVLIGPPGSGKSACGKLLAQMLSLPFTDTDSLIEADTGLTVAQIFARDGEGEFRRLETAALDRLRAEIQAGGTARVIAAGGGTPAIEGNWARLTALGVVVWLDCDLETLVGRLESEGGRPLLAGAGGRAEIRQRLSRLMAERQATYSKARYKVDTGHLHPEEVASRVIEVIGYTRLD